MHQRNAAAALAVTRAVAITCVLGLLAGGCATADRAPVPAVPPVDGFPVATPDSVGVDPVPLTRLSEWIRKDRLDVRSLLVVKDGRLVFERYGAGLDRDHNYELYSVTKTITALTFGAVAADGAISERDTVAPWIARARPDLAASAADKSGITLGHLMAMSSGLLYRQVEGSDPLYFQAPDRLAVALGTQPRIPPHTRFEYTDANPVLVGAALSAAARRPEQQVAEERLFRPLGMRNYRWTGADAHGAVSGGWGLRLRAIDMARLGQLMLDDGRWQGRQLVPAAWIRRMSNPTPDGTAQDYGYYCWINHVVESEREFGAMGFKGQFITVLPQQRAVVVMTAILPTDGGLRTGTYLNLYRRMVNDYVLPALQAYPAPAIDMTARRALEQELALAAQTPGIPGTSLAFNDGPEK